MGFQSAKGEQPLAFPSQGKACAARAPRFTAKFRFTGPGTKMGRGFFLAERPLGHKREEGRGRALGGMGLQTVDFSIYLPAQWVSSPAFSGKNGKISKNFFTSFLEHGKIPKTGLPTVKRGNEKRCPFEFHKIPPGGIGKCR